MKETVLAVGAAYAALSVILGAFGAHALKKIFTADLQQSFETGVKYQMYHALGLIILGYNLNFDTGIENALAYCLMIGIFLFSFSIYGLCLSSAKDKKLKFLGPVTPLGGLLLVAGWVLLFISFVS